MLWSLRKTCVFLSEDYPIQKCNEQMKTSCPVPLCNDLKCTTASGRLGVEPISQRVLRVHKWSIVYIRSLLCTCYDIWYCVQHSKAKHVVTTVRPCQSKVLTIDIGHAQMRETIEVAVPEIRSQLRTCHDNLSVVACAQLGLGKIIINKIRAMTF